MDPIEELIAQIRPIDLYSATNFGKTPAFLCFVRRDAYLDFNLTAGIVAFELEVPDCDYRAFTMETGQGGNDPRHGWEKYI